MKTVQIWKHDRYKDLLDNEAIRPGCEPKILVDGEHGEVKENSIVLLHGLTDSPYFMEAIGTKLYEMGFNVFIPLLPGHGLKDPQWMRGVTLNSWQEEVDFAVKYAQTRGKKVSIGGLSTGGTLSVWKAMTSPDEIKGGVFLFSAALGLAGSAGDFQEKLLRTRLLRHIVSHHEDLRKKPLMGNGLDDNPYRYSRMDIDGANQLSILIEQVEKLVSKNLKLNQPLFVAHSEYDTTADINEVEKFIDNHQDPEKETEIFRIGKYFHVPHASVVLAEDVNSANQSPLEPKNPFFDVMMKRIYKFAKKHLKAE